MTDRRIAGALLLLATLAGCTPWPCVDDTLAKAPSPDAAFVATVVRRNCGSTAEVVAYFSVQQAAGGGSHELFRMTGPFTAQFVWKQPRLLHVVVTDYLGDKTGSWMDIVEKQVAPYRDIRYADLHVIVGSARQFGRVPRPQSIGRQPAITGRPQIWCSLCVQPSNTGLNSCPLSPSSCSRPILVE